MKAVDGIILIFLLVLLLASAWYFVVFTNEAYTLVEYMKKYGQFMIDADLHGYFAAGFYADMKVILMLFWFLIWVKVVRGLYEDKKT